MNSLADNLKNIAGLLVVIALISLFVTILGKGIEADVKKTHEYNLNTIADHITTVCIEGKKMYFIQTSRGSESVFYKLDDAGIPIACKGD